MTVRRKQTATILPQGKGAPELIKRQLGTAQRPPTSGSACRNLKGETAADIGRQYDPHADICRT